MLIHLFVDDEVDLFLQSVILGVPPSQMANGSHLQEGPSKNKAQCCHLSDSVKLFWLAQFLMSCLGWSIVQSYHKQKTDLDMTLKIELNKKFGLK